MMRKIPFLIVLLQIFLGVFIAILFGVNEHFFKDRIQAGLDSHPKIVKLLELGTPESNAKASGIRSKEAGKNWRYYQRFHFHSTGIGAMSLGVLLLLTFLSAPKNQKLIAAYMIAVGGFLYPFVWLFAGVYGPSMGRSEAKEAFAIFGYMGGVFLLGVALSLYLVSRFPLLPLVDQSNAAKS